MIANRSPWPRSTHAAARQLDRRRRRRSLGCLRQSADRLDLQRPTPSRLPNVWHEAMCIDITRYRYNPFISYDFLSSLEASGSAAARTGWQPSTCSPRTADGRLLGAVPCYLKSHSRGEYVFDRGWAEAYERAGGSYYPKLQVSVPFTPATGRRLLVRPGAAGRGGARRRWPALVDALPPSRAPRRCTSPSCRSRNGGSWPRRAFCSAPTSSSIGRTPATPASTLSWRRSSSRKRKTIRRERRDALAERHHRALADRHRT